MKEFRSRIGNRFSTSNGKEFRTFNSYTNQFNEEVYIEASLEDVHEAVELARTAFFDFKNSNGSVRSNFLKAIATHLDAQREKLVAQFVKESSLSIERANSELNRTIFQLETFANVAESDVWRDPSIAHATVVSPDIRSCNEPLGTVVVFGASNFPFAYSTIGGDTASALSVGCPVIVKAHPMHAGTSCLVAEIILKVIEQLELPNGIFSHLLSNDYKVGERLVTHPDVQAVGFTGSINGGRALMDLAAKRPRPIPVFAEMGSVNPVVFLKEGLAISEINWVENFSYSISNDAGQFCTKPGLLFVPSTDSGRKFAHELQLKLSGLPALPQLHPAIFSHFKERRKALFGWDDSVAENFSLPILEALSSDQFQENPAFQEEFFGPQALLVFYDSMDELKKNLELFDGQLTASLIASETELTKEYWLIDLMKSKVGRLVFNGVPTGVTVCESMVHGGTYPASSDSRFTAVGSKSVIRFVRPVCFQNAPISILPSCLRC